jgi:hypothetical protein
MEYECLHTEKILQYAIFFIERLAIIGSACLDGHSWRKAHQCRSQEALVPVPVTGTKWPALT